MKTTLNPLPMLLGCAGLATVSLGMPTHTLAASCGRTPYASGPHALAVPARPSAGIALATAGIASSNDDFQRGSIVGLWHNVYTSGGVTAFESFDQWHADGNEFEAADIQLGAMCQGTWVKTGPGTVRLFHVGWNFDPTGVTLVGYFTEIQIDTQRRRQDLRRNVRHSELRRVRKSPSGTGSDRHCPCDTIHGPVSGGTA